MINSIEMDKFTIVKEVVDQYDFDGLLDWGRPIGEYDVVSGMISDAITEYSSVEEIATISQDIFNSIFGYGHEHDSCIMLASQIKEAMSIMLEPMAGTTINNNLCYVQMSAYGIA